MCEIIRPFSRKFLNEELPGEMASVAILRADGSNHIGMGHIFRCLAFADGLVRLHVEPVFVSRAYDQRVCRLIRSKGYELREIPPRISYNDDVQLTREIGSSVGANVVITDIFYSTALRDQEGLNLYHQILSKDFFTVCLTGGEVIDISTHLVIFPYYKTDYPNYRSDKKRTFLVGPRYFIFRQEFANAARVQRRIPEEARRILVTVGGGDEFHLTSKITKAICAIPGTSLRLRVILGPAFSHEIKQETASVLAEFDGEYHLLDHEPNLAKEMLWADLAVTSDGLTKYETAVTGTPNITLSHPRSDEKSHKEFVKAGTTLFLGNGCSIEHDELAVKIREVLHSYELRKSMSQRGKRLVDGRGLERIINRIPQEVL